MYFVFPFLPQFKLSGRRMNDSNWLRIVFFVSSVTQTFGAEGRKFVEGRGTRGTGEGGDTNEIRFVTLRLPIIQAFVAK